MIRAFRTDTGIDVPAVDATQMLDVDRIAIEETGPNLFQMMENAGRSLALCAFDLLGVGKRPPEVVVLAGSGGNGGGAICAARHLANLGADVRLCLLRPEDLGEVPSFQRHVFGATNGREVALDRLDDEEAALILDGVIGYSLHGAPRGPARDAIRWANSHPAPILALDVPSGVDATTGEAAQDFAAASRTLTLALPKTGLDPAKTGELLLADLGIPMAVYHRLGLEHTNPFDRRFGVPLTPLGAAI